ncbi:hypothetical protein ACFYW9_40925 [Streptomyces sp. NPDC002698]|uniref:hypothetical protein n=1 Tax=Streptomyces sp. NPDC002698 TaxID=3364660 RepID=UPI003683313B
MDPDSGVILARTAEGNALALGLLKCGRIWLCPVCSAKIRNGRAEEVSKAAVAWIEQGGTVLFATFTARHAAAHKLADLMDAIQGTRADAAKGLKRQPGAYQRLITGAVWAGDKRKASEGAQIGIRGRAGFIGMIRATEITLGDGNGWHPHIHALLFVGGRTEGERADKRIVEVFEPSGASLGELEDHFRAVWTRHLAKVDPAFTPSDEHGVVFEAVEKSADAVAKYLAKLQEGKDPGAELARADMKTGRAGNMTPFELLGRIGDLLGGVPEDDAAGHGSLDWGLSRWAEYETATKGRRAIEWTRYLRVLLDIDGDDSEDADLDILFQLDAASQLVSGAAVDTRAWHKLTGRALDLAATEAVEADDMDQVVTLVVAAGAKAGSVRVLSGEEIREAWEGTLAKLAERREAAAARRAIERA